VIAALNYLCSREMISTDDLILSTLHDAVDGIDANVNMIDKGLREGIIY